jgi:ribosomal protein L37E
LSPYEEGVKTIVNLTDMVMLFVFLVVFVIVPAIFIQLGSRRKHTHHSDLQECPSCGAENYKVKARCYCCGYDLVAIRSGGPSDALLQRVKRMDESRVRPPLAVETPQPVED